MIILTQLDVTKIESKKSDPVCTIEKFMAKYPISVINKYARYTSLKIKTKKRDILENKMPLRKKIDKLKSIMGKICSFDLYNDFNTFLNTQDEVYGHFDSCELVKSKMKRNAKKCSTMGEYMVQFGSDILKKFFKHMFIKKSIVQKSKHKKNSEKKMRAGYKTAINMYYKVFCNKKIPHYNLFNVIVSLHNKELFENPVFCDMNFVWPKE